MSAYVHADSKSVKTGKIKVLSSSRIVKAKIQTLFSTETVAGLCMILAAAVLMLADSYYKAYKINLENRIVEMLSDAKELEWQKSVSERSYLKMTSSEELMKKAKEMKLSVTTSDKFVKFD